MPSSTDLSKITPFRELRRRRWLKRIETLVPKMIDEADKEGGIVVSQLGKKRLSDGRVVVFTLEARLVHQEAGGAHKLR